jgi:non-ribosomal peptide synthetase component F
VFMVLLAAYAALLHRMSKEDDVVVGVPVAGRDLPELQPLIGMFVNMVVLRIDTSGDPSFDELLLRVRATALSAWDHQDMPYQKLVEALAARRDAGAPPLYQLGFNYVPGGFDDDTGTAEDDLMLEVAGSSGRIQYNTALFDAATAEAMVGDYQRILAIVLAEPGTRLSALPVSRVAQDPAAEATSAGKAYVPPRTAAEELVAEVWQEVLGVNQAGAFDDFFDLGGHSLLALRVIARLDAVTGTDLPIQDFFADTTLAGVASVLERQLTAEIAELSEEEAAARLAGGEPA